MLSRIRWRGLRTQIIAWSFVPTAIILMAVALVTFLAYRQVTEDLVIERNRELARLSAGQLTTALADHIERLTVESRDSDINAGNLLDQRGALARASNRLVVFDGGVVILDAFGRVMAAEPERPEIIGHNWSDRDYVRHMQVTIPARPVFSNIVSDGPDGAEVIVLAVPIIGPHGEFRGMMAGMFRVGSRAVSAFYGNIVRLRIAESGSAYLVDGNGRVIYHSDPDRIGEQFSSQPVVQQVLEGQSGARRTLDPDGQDTVASFAPVPGTAWGLVTQERWETLLRPSQGYRQFLLLLLVLGIIIPALVVAFGVTRITTPITELIGATKGVARGQFQQLTITRTGDEIEELTDHFNLMAAQLQESYANLEQRVAERTNELATLNTIAETVSQSLELEPMLTAALDKVLEILAFESGTIHLKDPGQDELEMACYRGLSEAFRRTVDKGIIGARVGRSGKPIIIDNLDHYPEAPQVLLEEGYRSIASIPLLSKEQVQGVLTTASRQVRHFRQEDVNLLLSVGHQIGVAIENARLFEAEQRRAEQFRVIGELGRDITSILDVDELLAQMVKLIKDAFGYYQVSIGLIEEGQVVSRAGAGPLSDVYQSMRLTVGQEGIGGWVAQHGQPLLVPNVSQEARYYCIPEAAQIRSELTVPMNTKEATIGVLDVQSRRVNAFDERDLMVLQALANQAAIALENAQLYEQAQHIAALEERQRLARELHDSVTQALYGVTLYAEASARLLSAGNITLAADHLEELRQTAQEALREMRLLIFELRPSLLEEKGLIPALQARLETVEGRAGLQTSFKVEGEIKLSPELEGELYRIAQESLNNALKHAQAHSISVILRRDGPCMALEIADDGIGFDPKTAGEVGGLGLPGITERVAQLGGRLTIESQPDKGTRIMVEVDS